MTSVRDGLRQIRSVERATWDVAVDEALFQVASVPASTGGEEQPGGQRDEAQQSQEKRAVTAAIHDFSGGADERDTERVARALHQEATQFVVLPQGMQTIDTATYLAAIKAGRIGGQPRQVVVDAIALNGVSATAAVRMDGPRIDFFHYLTLVKEHGAWKIVAAVTTVSGI